MSISDQQLINECLAGNEISCKTLYNRYSGYIYSLCVRFGVPKMEIKDYMQVIFSNMFQSLQKFDQNKSKFKTWFTNIAINHICKLRRNNTYRSLQMKDIDEIEYSIGTGSNVGKNLDIKTYYSILQKMPKKFLTVFNLFIIDGYSHKEISKMLSISVNSSRTLLHRGREWAKSKFRPLLHEIDQIENTKNQ